MSNAFSIDEAAACLRTGGIIAYPTEGVWGLGCNPRDEAAVLRLLAIKQRPVDKGLILIAADFGQLQAFVNTDTLPTARLHEIRANWPGPHTWVLPASTTTPRWITGAQVGIAVRVSAHPPVIALCMAFNGALVSTSANLAGQPAPQHRDELDPALLSHIDGVLIGETGGLQRATPIRDALTGEALRV
jgi:L-threonylcarbamoyladenylate synthase